VRQGPEGAVYLLSDDGMILLELTL